MRWGDGELKVFAANSLAGGAVRRSGVADLDRQQFDSL